MTYWCLAGNGGCWMTMKIAIVDHSPIPRVQHQSDKHLNIIGGLKMCMSMIFDISTRDV